MSEFSSPVSTTRSDRPGNLFAIQQNWSLPYPPVDAIPDSLRRLHDPLHWPLTLVEALRELSDLTAGRKQRAHDLMGTYCIARARERGRRISKHKSNTHNALEIEDVRNAIYSMRTILKGQAIQGLGTFSGLGIHASATPLDSRKRKHRSEMEYESPCSRPAKALKTITYDEEDTNDSPLKNYSSLSSFKSKEEPPEFSSNLSQYSPVSILQDIPDDLSHILGSPITNPVEEQPLAFQPTPKEEPYPDFLAEPFKEFSLCSPPISPKSNTDHELHLRRLELAKAQADLELSRQEHMVALKRVEVAKLEMRQNESQDLGTIVA